MAKNSSEFTQRTNRDYIEWCKTFYNAEALDERGMKSLDGLWAWQEQEKRIDALKLELSRIEVERTYETGVQDRMRKLLTKVADALKGPPAPNSLHDWSDLPVVAEKMRTALESSTHRIHTYPGGEWCKCSQCEFVRLRDAVLRPEVD